MKDTLRPILLLLMQIPLQLEYIKTKEDVLIEVCMLLISVVFGIGVLYAINIKNKVIYTKTDVFADCFIALFVTIIAHYAMLFYHSTYPRFIVDFFVSLFAYKIIISLKKAGEKRIAKLADKAIDIIDTES